ncbi:MAG: DUF2089 domain-containing protein [Fimbriimonadales bacterium]
MSKDKFRKLLTRDPVGGGDLYVSELTSDDSGVTVRGRFEIPRYARLDEDQSRFLETFLRCRGMLNSVERELGISYPTVRARLDGLLSALDLAPIKDEPKKDRSTERKKQILELLEKGEITAEEAKTKLKAVEK